jgi:enoyl-CoA hydratase/carnithine racemase
MSDTVLYENRGAVAILTLNRPDQRNSVNVELTGARTFAIPRAS